MKDLYNRVELVVSNAEAVLLYGDAGVPQGATIMPVKQNKLFVPSNDMTMSELAEVLSVYINVKLSGGALTPEEFEQLPSSVTKYFKNA